MNKYINHRELLEILELAKEDVLQEDIRAEDKLLMLYGLNYAIIAIENTLPADVQPVRHGRWITVTDVNGKEYSKCADCQMELDGLEDAYSFCPYCGAKMDDGRRGKKK